jgi:hypothetical protein
MCLRVTYIGKSISWPAAAVPVASESLTNNNYWGKKKQRQQAQKGNLRGSMKCFLASLSVQSHTYLRCLGKVLPLRYTYRTACQQQRAAAIWRGTALFVVDRQSKVKRLPSRRCGGRESRQGCPRLFQSREVRSAGRHGRGLALRRWNFQVALITDSVQAISSCEYPRYLDRRDWTGRPPLLASGAPA